MKIHMTIHMVETVQSEASLARIRISKIASIFVVKKARLTVASYHKSLKSQDVHVRNSTVTLQMTHIVMLTVDSSLKSKD